MKSTNGRARRIKPSRSGLRARRPQPRSVLLEEVSMKPSFYDEPCLIVPFL